MTHSLPTRITGGGGEHGQVGQRADRHQRTRDPMETIHRHPGEGISRNTPQTSHRDPTETPQTPHRDPWRPHRDSPQTSQGNRRNTAQTLHGDLMNSQRPERPTETYKDPTQRHHRHSTDETLQRPHVDPKDPTETPQTFHNLTDPMMTPQTPHRDLHRAPETR